MLEPPAVAKKPKTHDRAESTALTPVELDSDEDQGASCGAEDDDAQVLSEDDDVQLESKEDDNVQSEGEEDTVMEDDFEDFLRGCLGQWLETENQFFPPPPPHKPLSLSAPPFTPSAFQQPNFRPVVLGQSVSQPPTVRLSAFSSPPLPNSSGALVPICEEAEMELDEDEVVPDPNSDTTTTSFILNTLSDDSDSGSDKEDSDSNDESSGSTSEETFPRTSIQQPSLLQSPPPSPPAPARELTPQPPPRSDRSPTPGPLPEETTTDEQKLLHWCHEKGFQWVKTVPDGNCFYRAVSLLTTGSPNHHQQLRLAAHPQQPRALRTSGVRLRPRPGETS